MEKQSVVPFVSRQRVYFDMLDLLGMLHNAAFLVLFERARTDFWRAVGYVPGAAGYDWPYLVKRNEITYHVSITTDEEVDVTVSVAHLGRTSLIFAHTILLPDGTLAAEGQTVLVRVDPNRRPLPWSDAFRSLLAPYLSR